MLLVIPGDEESTSAGTPEQMDDDEGRLIIGEDEDSGSQTPFQHHHNPGSMLETQVIEYPIDFTDDRKSSR